MKRLSFLVVLLVSCISFGCSVKEVWFDASRNPDGILATPEGTGLLSSFGVNVYPQTHIYVLNVHPQDIYVECNDFGFRGTLSPGKAVPLISKGYSRIRVEVTCFARATVPGKTHQVVHKTFSLGNYGSQDEIWEPRFNEYEEHERRRWRWRRRW